MRAPVLIVVLLSAIAVLVGVIACTAPMPDPDEPGTWVGTTTTEGDVTTVVTEAGSIWGGTATLVEEASIGVEAGADPYMFGSVRAVFATDEHIYVLDGQLPQLRYYDLEGTFVGNVGQPGQGPGEYQEPFMLTGDNAGRIFLYDTRAGILVFSEEGAALDTWSFGIGPGAMVATPDGTLWARQRVDDPDMGGPRYGLGEFGPAGLIGEIRRPSLPPFEPVQTTITFFNGRSTLMDVPFAPRSDWTVGPDGAVVAWATDRLRYEIQDPSGRLTLVEMPHPPIAVEPAEADWHRRLFIARMSREPLTAGWTWDGAEMPEIKPAFTTLTVAPSGEVWIVRPGPGERVADCVTDPVDAGYRAATEAPCWRDRTLIDVFGADGRYLGAVDPPAGFGVPFFVRGERVIGAVHDERGFTRVRSWRLVTS